MRLKLTLFSLFSSFFGWCQSIEILDRETSKPVENATIYNASHNTTTITDRHGIADITAFTNSESIFIRHISHQNKRTTKAAVIAAGNRVYMEPGNNELDAVVLSVAKFKQESQDLAQQVVTITPEEATFRNPQTAADLLASSGEVYVQKSQLGGGSPMIRGFSTNRLLLSVDGVRMNTAIFRSGNLQNVINIDPFALSRTEVILGPGSVVYGSDAIGGAMNFYTLQPQLAKTEDATFSGSAVARFSTANTEKTGHVDFNLGNKKWAFLSSLSYSDYEDLRMGNHGPEDYLRPEYVARINGKDVVVQNDHPKKQVPTGFDQFHLMQKARYMPNDTWNLNLGLIYSTTSDYARYDRLTRKRNGKLRAAEWYYGPQDWFFSNLQINKKGYGPLYDQAKITAAYQNFKESRRDRDFGKDVLFETEEHVDAYSLALDFNKNLKNIRLFYGLEYVYNKVGSQGRQTNIITGIEQPDASRYPDGSSWRSIAGYVNGQFRLSKKLNLQSGLRYNQVLVDATFDDRFYDFPFAKAHINTGNLTGSLGLAWQVNPILGWKFNFSTAFRTPNIDDVGKVFDSEPGSVVVPNPDLKSEYAYNYEVGLNLNFEDVVRLDLAAYYTRLDNALVRRDFTLGGSEYIDYQGERSRVQAIQNLAQAEVVGLEAGVHIFFNREIRLHSQLNIVSGNQEEDDGGTAPLRHAAPLFGNAHLIWERDKLKLDAYAEYNGQLNYSELAPSQQGNAYLYALDANGDPYAPRWYTLNVASQYRFNKSWQLNASLENITDQRYRPYSSGISAAGRNFVASVRFRF